MSGDNAFGADPFGPGPFSSDPFTVRVNGVEPLVLAPGDSYAIASQPEMMPLRFEISPEPPAARALASVDVPAAQAPVSDAEIPHQFRSQGDAWIDLRKVNAFHLPEQTFEEPLLNRYDASRAINKPQLRSRGSGMLRTPRFQPLPCPVCGGPLGRNNSCYCESCDIRFCEACMKPLQHGCCTDPACAGYAEPCERCGRPIHYLTEHAFVCGICGRTVCSNCSLVRPGGEYHYLCVECADLCARKEEEQPWNVSQFAM